MHQGGQDVQIQLILDLDTRLCERSVSHPISALPSGKGPPTNWRGGWLSLRTGLDTEAKGKIRYLYRGLNPVIQAVVRHYSV
jgi:hypothetical protein